MSVGAARVQSGVPVVLGEPQLSSIISERSTRV